MPKISYALTREDHIDFHNFLLKRQCGSAYVFSTKFCPIICFICGVGILIGAWKDYGLVPPSGAWLSTYGFALLMFALSYWNIASRQFTLMQASKNPDFGKQAQLELTDVGVSVIDSSSESTIYWTRFIEIVEDTEHLLFFFNKKQAIVVPKRCFSSSAEAQSFFDFAKSHFSSNHPAKSAAPIAHPK